ncbi:MAG: hypothetical protein ACTSQS_14930 [Promethearchaeota archaeon]
MKIQTVFIIDKRDNVLIFLELLDETISLNQETLAEILSEIISRALNLNLNSCSMLKIHNDNYLIGNFSKLFVITQYKDTEPPKELLEKIYEVFIEQFFALLNNYNEEDIPKFKQFSPKLKELIINFEKGEKIKEKEIPKATIEQFEPTKAENINNFIIGEKPIIDPMKRDAYPEGIPEYKRDEVLWEEAQAVQAEYVAEFVEGMIFHLKIFLSISLTHHYEVYIDFSDYPNKPKITIGEGLREELGKPLEELLFFLKNWDPKIPPHIMEIVRELEAVLMKYKAKGKLSDTSELPETALPELEPLPEIPPLEEEEEKKQEIESNQQSKENQQESKEN